MTGFDKQDVTNKEVVINTTSNSAKIRVKTSYISDEI